MSQIKSSIIENKFLRIKAINIGASLFEVFYKPKKINLILNLGNYKNYLLQKAYVGSTCGRVVNRIRNSQFSIGVRKYNLVANEGKSSLHGGIDNFSYRIWKIENCVVVRIGSHHNPWISRFGIKRPIQSPR